MSANRVLSLRRFINDNLSSLSYQHYYEGAPKDAEYPFLVYNLEEAFDDGSVETFNLLFDGWDAKSDTTELEEIMGMVDNSFHRLNGTDGELFFIFYRSNRRSLIDPDKRLRRRQLEFEIKVMGGNQ